MDIKALYGILAQNTIFLMFGTHDTVRPIFPKIAPTK